jgi:hypothetical protein
VTEGLDAQALAAFRRELDQLGGRDGGHLDQMYLLVRAFPCWAIWQPVGSGEWTAVRPASSRLPDPELPMVWVQAANAGELADRMWRTDTQVAPRDGQPGWP